MKNKKIAILWIRQDLRLHDNQALIESLNFDYVIPCFVLQVEKDQEWQLGAASKWWLHHSLQSFQLSLEDLGSKLLLLKGEPEKELIKVARHYKATRILWNRNYNPQESHSVQALMREAQKNNLETVPCHGSVLCEKNLLLKDDGSPYRVYTAFWKKFLKVYKPQHLDKPDKLPPVPEKPQMESLSLKKLNLLPKVSWDSGFGDYWQPGEQSAIEKTASFIKNKIFNYQKNRDSPQLDGTSMLSPHLRFGEIHPQRILYQVVEEFGPLAHLKDPNIIQFAKEILWREFSYHLLQHFPATTNQPLVESFQRFPYKQNKKWFDAWTKGATGYPVVDAGMRQLWKTGWMHNRVRMITASFLVKHLGIHWLEGAKWFWDTLVDADLASNTQGWQWTAGCGADAAPFFRIFNPITQGQKFDPQGEYVSLWCPEISNLPSKWIHKPWEASKQELTQAGICLGVDYPNPIVEHKASRERALSQYEQIKQAKTK